MTFRPHPPAQTASAPRTSRGQNAYWCDILPTQFLVCEVLVQHYRAAQNLLSDSAASLPVVQLPQSRLQPLRVQGSRFPILIPTTPVPPLASESCLPRAIEHSGIRRLRERPAPGIQYPYRCPQKRWSCLLLTGLDRCLAQTASAPPALPALRRRDRCAIRRPLPLRHPPHGLGGASHTLSPNDEHPLVHSLAPDFLVQAEAAPP